MPAAVVLPVSVRTVFGKDVVNLRRSGVIPAVVYGRGFDTEHIQIPMADFTRVIGKASSSTILTLQSERESYQALMHDWAKDPVTDRYLHIDFLRIRADEEIDADVPLVFIGESSVVKEQGGVLVTNMNAVSVRCLPADLPEHLTVDLSGITEFGRPIHVSDLVVPAGVRVISSVESPIVSVTHIRVEEETVSTQTVPESAKEAAVEGGEVKKEEGKKEKKEEGKKGEGE